MLKPVLRLVDNAQVGTIAGVFNPTPSTCGTHAPVVYVYPGANVMPDDIYLPPAGASDVDLAGTAEPLTTATAALNSASLYAYSVGFLPVGTYTVAFTCDPDDPTVDEDTINFTTYTQPVTVSTNMTSTANFPPPPP
jgi:hypothetical protein